MRSIVTHRGSVSGPTNLDNSIAIDVLDEPGDGGACHEYRINVMGDDEKPPATLLHFQNGPLIESGHNGISVESLLAVVIDRLEGFQSGKFACESNQAALDSTRGALHALLSRREDRQRRQVLGTHGA